MSISSGNPAVLFAPVDYWELTDAQRKEICNGCGTKGVGGYLVPDTIYGMPITAACNIHDFQYATGETIADKDSADRSFLNNMLRLIDANTTYDWLKRLRKRRAEKYYWGVNIGGGPAFWRDKNRPEEMGAA